MRIANDALRCEIIDVLDQTQRLAPLVLNTVIAEIAQVLTDDRLFTAHQTKGVFQICAQTEYGRYILKPRWQRQCIRHVAP